MRLIEVDKVSKVFRPRRGPSALLARRDLASLLKGQPREHVTALEGISFTVDQGESVGIIGANGSGKSTLLKLLAGVTLPTSGTVEVHGRVVSLLELGAGFHHLLTGRENIYLNARILGMSRGEVNQVFDQIVEFSGIGEFIDNPVNTYSSGMFVRLGFAVAVHTNPDIFLIDEVLSVGDEEFQRKCRTRIGELREQGKTIVFVSHDLGIVNTLCNRVILLSRGRMITRGTPQATIEYYLRQIGRDSGIHTFSKGNLEVIFCHGRISLFYKQQEVSAPRGVQMHLLCMNQWHASVNADWVLDERTPTGCRARGRMSRLPVVLHWDMRIEDDTLRWHVAFECEHDTALAMFRCSLFWPGAYAHWVYGDLSGAFPDILPGDQDLTTVAPFDATCRETAALPKKGSALPPMVATLEAHYPYLSLVWSNSDYVTGARVLQVMAQMPETETVLRAGRHEVCTLEVDLGLTAEQVRARAAAREAEGALHVGPLRARFYRGAVLLSHEEKEITRTVHLHTEMLIAHIWNVSHDMQWSTVQRQGDCLRVSGDSPRFPFRQHWEIEAAPPKGIAFRVWFEALEPIDVQEYNVSIGLNPDYDRWETVHESGAFPPFDPEQKDWRHINHNYAPGRFVRAFSPTLPSVSLETSAEDVPFRMTVINSGYEHSTRVLQAIRSPDKAQWLHFEQGRHLWFEGVVAVEPGVAASRPERHENRE